MWTSCWATVQGITFYFSTRTHFQNCFREVDKDFLIMGILVAIFCFLKKGRNRVTVVFVYNNLLAKYLKHLNEIIAPISHIMPLADCSRYNDSPGNIRRYTSSFSNKPGTLSLLYSLCESNILLQVLYTMKSVTWVIKKMQHHPEDTYGVRSILII